MFSLLSLDSCVGVFHLLKLALPKVLPPPVMGLALASSRSILAGIGSVTHVERF